MGVSRQSVNAARKSRKAVRKDIKAKGASRRGKSARAEQLQRKASKKRRKASDPGFLSSGARVKKSKDRNILGGNKNKLNKKGRVKR